MFAAGGRDDKSSSSSVRNELEQLRDGTDESLEQSLVRRGEMTPFGTVLNNTSEVSTHLLRLLCSVLFDRLTFPELLQVGLVT